MSQGFTKPLPLPLPVELGGTGVTTSVGSGANVLQSYVDVNDTQEQFIYEPAGSPHTWTKPANFNDDSFIEVCVTSGGGGSGGNASTGSGQAAESGSGGAGATSYKKIMSGDLSATETVTVGAGGTAGAAGNNAGGAGGTSSFGSHVSCTGGGGGNGGAATTLGASTRGLGGLATGGDLNMQGGDGCAGAVRDGVPSINTQGGVSFYTGYRTHAGSGSGLPGNSYGGGATGCSSTASNAVRAGAVGGAGVITVKEHY